MSRYDVAGRHSLHRARFFSIRDVPVLARKPPQSKKPAKDRAFARALEQVPRLTYGRGAGTSRSIFRLRTRAGIVGSKRTDDIPDSDRLALPRSPESGFAVSACVIFLSRGKRKMSVRNFQLVYI